MEIRAQGEVKRLIAELTTELDIKASCPQSVSGSYRRHDLAEALGDKDHELVIIPETQTALSQLPYML